MKKIASILRGTNCLAVFLNTTQKNPSLPRILVILSICLFGWIYSQACSISLCGNKGTTYYIYFIFYVCLYEHTPRQWNGFWSASKKGHLSLHGRKAVTIQRHSLTKAAAEGGILMGWPLLCDLTRSLRLLLLSSMRGWEGEKKIKVQLFPSFFTIISHRRCW